MCCIIMNKEDCDLKKKKTGSGVAEVTPKSAQCTQAGRLAEGLAMSGLEAEGSSNEALELMDEKAFDVEVDRNADFDYGHEPFRYLFYR